MSWWFLILALGGGAVLWAGISAYLRVRSHMKQPPGAGTKAGTNREGDVS